MLINDYQEAAIKTIVYKPIGKVPLYPALGLAGEAGEVANKVKKYIREDGIASEFTKKAREDVVKELGDVLWYLAVLSNECGYTLEEVAQLNINKLLSRKERGVLHGDGDNR